MQWALHAQQHEAILTVFGWAHIELNHWPFSSNFTVRIGLSDPSVPPKWSIRNGSTTWNSLNWSIYKTITISFVFLCRLTNFLLDNRRKQVHDYILMWDVDNNPSILFWRGFAWFYGWVVGEERKWNSGEQRNRQRRLTSTCLLCLNLSLVGSINAWSISTTFPVNFSPAHHLISLRIYNWRFAIIHMSPRKTDALEYISNR